VTVQTINVSTTDTYVNSSTPTTAPTLTTSLHSSSGLWSLFEFIVPAAPAGETLVSVDFAFRTTVSASAGSVATQSIQLTTSAWSQSSTWNTRPTLGSVVGTVPANTLTDTAYTVSLDTSILGPLAGTTVGLAMNSTNTDSMQWRSSREAVTAYRATLTFTYAASTFTAAFTATGTLAASLVFAPSGLSFPTKASSDTLYTPAPTVAIAASSATTITGATLIPPDSTLLRMRGAGAFAFGTGTPGSALYNSASRYPNTWGNPPVWGYTFMLTGTQFETVMQVANGTYSCFRIKVDGKRVTDLPQMMAAQTPVVAAGAHAAIKITFATSATRRITIETGYMPLRGVYAGTGSTITQAPAFTTRLIVLGDSITGSSAQTTGLGNGVWLPRLASYAGVDDPWNEGIGGTGYQSATATTFINRIPDLNYSPNAIIYWGGYNDLSFSAASEQTAATAVFNAGKAAQPSAEHYVIGCWSPNSPAIALVTATDGALKAAAAAAGVPFASPSTGSAYNAAGTLIGTYEPLIRNTTDVTNMIGTDGVHPNDAGNVRIAEWMREVLILMSGAPAPFVASFSGTGTLTATVSSLTAPTVTPSRTVLSQENVSIVATTTVIPELWEIEQVGGNVVTLGGGFGSWTFTAPATWGGLSVPVRVRYQVGGVLSDWSPVSTFTVLRHAWWVQEATGPVPYTVGAPPPAPTAPTAGLFFAQPDYSGPKLYMAHFYPPYPRRIENIPADGVDLASSDYYSRNYLNPTGGSETANAPFGGVLRTRPMPLVPVAAGLSFETDNARREIQDANDADLDGFFTNITNTTGANLLRCQQLRDVAAAEFPGFIVAPMLDTSTASALSTAAPAAVASLIASFANKPCTKYLADGRMLIGSFQGDTQTVAWWTTLQSTLLSTYNITIAVCGAYNSFQTATEAHKTVLYASGQWGYGADPSVQNASTGLATEKAYAAARGVKNMRGVWMQDIRPFAGVFDEACNTEALRAAWTLAIGDDVEIIQLCTWSDLKEGSAFYRTETRGRVGADISAWYAAWWKTGAAPTILKDAAYLTHRQAPLSAVPTGSQTQTMQQWKPPTAGGRNNTSALRESVEALVFLTAPATVRITSNGTSQDFAAPAGMSAWLKAAGLGAVKVEVIRGTVNVITLASPITISSSWPNDHREYAAFGSIRGTGGQRASWPRPSATTTPTAATPWLPFELPTTESLIASGNTRNVIVGAHPMGGSWVTPQQTTLDTDPDYTDKNYLYYPPDNRSVSGLTSAGSTITETATKLINGDVLFFTAKGAATNIVLGTVYFVVGKATNTFQVAATSGGTAIALGTATGIAYTRSTLKNLYGGEWRDRYSRRPTRPEASGTWQVLDIEWEIRAAQSAGINAFTWGTSQRASAEWTRLQYALKAASNHNAASPTQPFYIIPWVLSLSSITGTPGAETPTQSGQILADLFTGLINNPLYANGFMKRNGRTLFMPYSPNSAQSGTGSSSTPAAGVTTSGMEFYQALDARMTANGTPADWYQVFQSNWTGLPPFYESTGGAMGHFGSRDYNTTNGNNSSYLGARAFLQTTLGLTYRNQASPPMPYIAPISHQAFVPRGTPTQVGGNGIMWESGGTQNLVNSCLSAIAQYNPTGLNIINLNTWNDFAEGSPFAPSKQNGFHWLDLFSWYMVQMVTGSYPTIVRDGIYLTHRKQKTTGGTYTSVQKKLVIAAGTPSGSTFTGTTWIDILDVTAFLVSAATLEVTSGANTPVTFSLTPGRNRVSVPLAVGTQTARIIRGGVDAVVVTSPIVVSNTQLVQDMTYYGTSNFASVARPVPVIPD
jgi:lysophospholipase L1-like esterase